MNTLKWRCFNMNTSFNLHACFHVRWYLKNYRGRLLTIYRNIIENYNKRSAPGPLLNHWLQFSCIFPEDDELYIKFDGTEMKIKADKSKNKINKLFCKNIEVIEK